MTTIDFIVITIKNRKNRKMIEDGAEMLRINSDYYYYCKLSWSAPSLQRDFHLAKIKNSEYEWIKDYINNFIINTCWKIPDICCIFCGNTEILFFDFDSIDGECFLLACRCFYNITCTQTRMVKTKVSRIIEKYLQDEVDINFRRWKGTYMNEKDKKFYDNLPYFQKLLYEFYDLQSSKVLEKGEISKAIIELVNNVIIVAESINKFKTAYKHFGHFECSGCQSKIIVSIQQIEKYKDYEYNYFWLNFEHSATCTGNRHVIDYYVMLYAVENWLLNKADFEKRVENERIMGTQCYLL